MPTRASGLQFASSVTAPTRILIRSGSRLGSVLIQSYELVHEPTLFQLVFNEKARHNRVGSREF